MTINENIDFTLLSEFSTDTEDDFRPNDILSRSSINFDGALTYFSSFFREGFLTDEEYLENCPRCGGSTFLQPEFFLCKECETELFSNAHKENILESKDDQPEED